MKTLNLSLLLTVLALGTTLLINKDSGKESTNPKASYEYLNQELTNAKSYTLEVLDAMPADKYSFKPADEVRSFGAQAYHIAYSLEFFNGQLSGKAIEWAPGDEDALTKEELVTYTTEQFDAFLEIVANAEESGRFTSGILATLRHNAHHRGQMIIYLRENGITPPSYK